MTQELFKEFTNPSAAWRGKPFWSWNGKLEKDELIRQIHVMKQMGLGGYFMHSRTGLITEYLGGEWFELINACADEGERLGMEAWLYDEDRWPSGTAGGMVTKEPRFRLKFLRLIVKDAADFQWDPLAIAAFACRLDGMAYTDCVRLRKDSPAAEREGRKVLVYKVEEMAPSSFYNGYTYVDTMNAEATDYYIRLTHEKYKAHCGERLGKSIRGIFTDEPHRGALMDGFSVPNPDPQWRVPWTFKTFDQFEKTFGYDLVPRLPELFLWPEGRKVSQVKWHYVELCQQMFIDNFAKPYDRWCRANNMIVTGHILHEDSLAAQTAVSGSVMRDDEHMEAPGVDLLTEDRKTFWVVKQLTSAARQLGRKWLLSELYGCTGWQMPFAGHKAVGDWQTLFGINLRCHHLSWYTMEGEAKRDYPASILHQSAWWPDYHFVETYFARLGLLLNQGLPCCDLLVVNPVESVWCQVYPGWSRGLGAQSPDVQALERAYADTFHWLAGAQVDFDYGDEEMMSRLARVGKDAEGRPVLHVGEAVYKAVLVSGMTTIRSTTLDLLRRFRAVGGTVIYAGEPPAYVDALTSDGAALAAGEAIRTPFDKESLVAAIDEAVAPVARALDPATSEPLGEVFAQVRRLAEGDKTIAVFLNVNRKEWFRGAKLRLRAAGTVEEWNCLTGERTAVPAAAVDGCLEFAADFPPAGEHAYIVTPVAAAGLPEKPTWKSSEPVQIEGPLDYRLSEPNVCVLDYARYRLGGEAWQGPLEILKADRALRERVGLPLRGGEMFQPWFVKQQGYEVKGHIGLEFEFMIGRMPVGPIELAAERPENFVIRLNDVALNPATVQGWWIDKAFSRLPLPPGLLRTGRNVIEMEADFHYGLNLEAIYLLGGFGVALDGTRKTLVGLPHKLEIDDLTAQGLPFFSGTITYSLPAPRRPAAGEAVFVTIPAMEAACAKVAAPGHAPRMIGWHPYEA
ncbi:MAG: hypothetical protein M1457_13585, partial [bacterium]|nr:hypothetical protein [bacterium]